MQLSMQLSVSCVQGGGPQYGSEDCHELTAGFGCRQTVRSFRSHFGSSHFLFERAYDFSASRVFFLVLSKCLQKDFVVSHLFSLRVLMMDQTCQYLLCQPRLRFLVLLMLPALISTESVITHSMHGSKSSEMFLLPLARGFADFDNHVKAISEAVGAVTSRITSVEQTVNTLSAKMALFAEMEQNVSALNHNVSSVTARICKIETNAASALSGSSIPSLPRWSHLKKWKLISVPSLHAYESSKKVQLPQVSLARQGLGIYLDTPRSPQPRGPVARGLLTITGTQDADLILSRTQMTKLLEVPSCYSFHVNNSTLECLLGSRSSGQRPTYPLSIQI